jgi:hypothetical protein
MTVTVIDDGTAPALTRLVGGFSRLIVKQFQNRVGGINKS